MTQARESGPQAQVVEGLRNGTLLLQRCRFSGEHYFYPRSAAAGVRPGEWDMVQASGRGVVHVATRIDLKGDAASRYDVALVDLEEGPRLLARFASASDQLPAPGTPVRVRIVEAPWAAALGHPVPVLELAGEIAVGSAP